MYAARKLYVKNWEHQSEDERYSVQIARGGKPVPGIQSARISSIDEDVMQWRKADHIHGWFVDNVQNGDDDTGDHYVEWDKLSELLAVCKEVIKGSKLVEGTIAAETVYDKDHPDGVTRRVPGKVIEDSTIAAQLLPARPGFFFGSHEYNEDYLTDVKETARWAAEMLQDYHDGVPGDIYYSSSW